MRRLAAVTISCAALVLAAACASPQSKFYTLNAPTASTAAAASNLSVSVGPVTVPAEVDRPQIVIATGPNQVQLDEFNRWAAPLQNGIARAVAENLVAMLGTSRVTQYTQMQNFDADYRVLIAVQGFESAPGKSAALDAFWTVRRTKDGKTQAGRTTVREPTQEQGYDALVAAHSRAITRLSQDIAGGVRLLQGSAP